jgi:tetraacyldisaccharide 4'-kinase
MRQALESWLLKNWYGTVSPPNLILRLLEPLYRLILKIRRHLVKPAKLNRPVIIVGNLTVGGSGKTPLVIALCRLLHENGFAVGVISRGYGRTSSTRHRVSDQDTANVAGDEPLLISRQTEAVVAVADKRIEAAALLDAVELDVLIADDGLQHYQLPRAMEICVIDGIRRFGSGRATQRTVKPA